MDESPPAGAAMLKSRRKTDKSGWYERIPFPADDTRPRCSRCSARTYIIDQDRGECLRCRLERQRTVREQEPFTA